MGILQPAHGESEGTEHGNALRGSLPVSPVMGGVALVQVCDNPDHAAHYHMLGLGWLQSHRDKSLSGQCTLPQPQ
jgi:hypothetical protein